MSQEMWEPNAGRVESTLASGGFFRVTDTRRKFMRGILRVGGAALGGAVGVAALGREMRSTPVAVDPVTDFCNTAVGAERIASAFYCNGLNQLSPFGVPADVPQKGLLDTAHRYSFYAARNQEDTHRAVLQSLGFDFPLSVFQFPPGTFGSASAMLAFGEQMESVIIGAYLGAIKAAASATNSLITEAAAQILGVECEHRAVLRDIDREDPPNDRYFEGDIGGPDSTLGNTGARSAVYASATDAFDALLALGITPIS